MGSQPERSSSSADQDGWQGSPAVCRAWASRVRAGRSLRCPCRRHHRIKTFARGWHFELLADGRLIVRTPSGVSRITRPPGWCYDPEPDPPPVEDQAPPDRLRC
jgi:hypothetical protein